MELCCELKENSVKEKNKGNQEEFEGKKDEDIFLCVLHLRGRKTFYHYFHQVTVKIVEFYHLYKCHSVTAHILAWPRM